MENNDHYVINPEECVKLNPASPFTYKQAQVFCKDCNTYQNLTANNSHNTTPAFDFKRSTYYGSCLTTECELKIAETAREKLKENIWFAQESYLQSRCDRADATCNLSSVKHGIRPGTIEDATTELTETERREDETYNALITLKKEYYTKYCVVKSNV